jgi:uncharacterized membrane protein YeiH
MDFHYPTALVVLDYAGVAVFAATGALAAARRGFDIVTFGFFAAVTGIGGGTLRDLLIGAPVFWVRDAGYLGVCIATAGVVWAFGRRMERFRSLLWLDAIGLAAYSVVGAAKAATWGVPPLVAIGMGVLSASFGGIVRDVLAGEPSVLLKKQIYVTAALVGSSVFVVLRYVGSDEVPAGIVGVAAAFALRAGAIMQGWTLPGFGENRSVVAPTQDVSPTLLPATPPSPAPAPASTPKPRAPRRPRAPRQP